MRSILSIFIVVFACPAGVFAQTQQPSLDDLIAIVNGKDSIKSAEAITAIGKFKPTSDLAIQTLVGSLADVRRAAYIPDIRHAAAVALGNLQEKAVTAIPRLTRLVEEEESEGVKNAAVQAVRQITRGQTESHRTKR